MNAATVIGPRSRISSAIFALKSAIPRSRAPSPYSLRTVHECSLAVAPDQELRDAARLRLCCSSRPASDAVATGWPLTDRITSPGRRLRPRRAVGVDVGNNGAASGPTAAAAGAPFAASDSASVKPKPAAPCSSGVGAAAVIPASTAQGLLFGLEIELLDGHVERLLLLLRAAP